MFNNAQFGLKQLTAYKSKNGKARGPVNWASLGVVELRPAWFRKGPGVYTVSTTAIVAPRRNLKFMKVAMNIRNTGS